MVELWFLDACAWKSVVLQTCQKPSRSPMTHNVPCFLSGSMFKPRAGNETKSLLISIVCCFEGKLLALTVWKKKKKNAFKEFNFLNYYQNMFLFITLVLVIQLDKVTEKYNWVFPLPFFFSPQTSCIKFKLNSKNLATVNGNFLLVLWNMNFLDQWFSNFRVHVNQWGFLIKYRLSIQRSLVGPETL